MPFQSVLITGGAGFVGSQLAIRFSRQAEMQVIAMDNLKRRGSELNLPRLDEAGVRFIHGDIRNPEDLQQLPEFQCLIDCAAEPSVQAGVNSSPAPVIAHNLLGTLNCLELARRRGAGFLFISTSRIYPITTLNQLPYDRLDTRFQWQSDPEIPGFSTHGIAEQFPLDGPRSVYGATKLAGELMLQEYAYNYQMPALINRCGIITGPWQMGKVDQGVVTLWVARHLFKKPLKYIGFNGTGLQVRDMLHIDDLFQLLAGQCRQPELWDGRIYNVGGGPAISSSLLELTEICQQITGNTIPITPVAETSPVDLRIYLTDTRKVTKDCHWQPQHNVRQIVSDIHTWIVNHQKTLAPILG